MDFDTLLVSYLGEFGTYQILILLFVCSTSFNSVLSNLDYLFTGFTPPFRCGDGNVEHLMNNLTFQELSKLISPEVSSSEVDACQMYIYNFTEISVVTARDLLESNKSDVLTKKCTSWIFSQEDNMRTIVTDFNLVCDRKWYVATSQAVYLAGFFTIFIGGILSDRFGRRVVTLGCMLAVMVCRIFVALSPNIYVFMVGRFFQACSTSNWYTSVFIIALENIGPSRRTVAGLVPYIFWSVGHLFVSGLSYLIRDWRVRNFVYLIFIIPYFLHFCFLKESVRWLKTHEKDRQAAEVVHLIARVNKKDLPDHVLADFNEVKKTSEEKVSLMSLLKSRMFIKLTLILVVLWMNVNTTYYGLIYYIPDMGGNLYLNTLISGGLELVALLYVFLTLDTRLGRRYSSSLLFLVAGVILLVIIFLPSNIAWLKVTLALIGRLGITAVFAQLYILAAEIYPTRMRSCGLALCSSASRFGAVISPYVAKLATFGVFLPPLIFGVLSLCSAVLCLLLPETRGKHLKNYDIQTTQPNTTAVPETQGLELTECAKVQEDSKASEVKPLQSK